MKATLLHRPRKGFTLIELLIVIAILASLGAIGYGVYFSMFDKGKASAAKQVCVQLATASETFFQDQAIPPFDLNKFDSREEQLHFATNGKADGGMITVLLGQEEGDSEGRRLNPTNQQYITGDVQEQAADGLYQTQDGTMAYYDPWGSPYYIIYCESDSGAVDPFIEKGRPLRGKHFLVYSLGPDQDGLAPISQEVKDAKKEAKKQERKERKRNKKMTKKEKAAAKEAARIAAEDEKAAYEDNIFSWKN